MISIFDYNDPRTFIKKRLQEMPKQGYGHLRKLSEFVGIHTTLTSQVLSGLKSFTPEQACLVAEYFGLSDIESEYFVSLVLVERAGNQNYKKMLKQRLESLRKQSAEIVNRVQVDRILTDEQRAVFYSDWLYTAIRQLCSIEGYNSIDQIQSYLGVSRRRVKQIVDFLLLTKLCVEEKGKLKVGPKATHLESSSPWVRVHHINWREKAIGKMSDEGEDKLHFTCPLTLSKRDVTRVREKIIQFINEVNAIVDPSPSEELHCLNIDWFKI